MDDGFSEEVKNGIRELLGDSINDRQKAVLEARCLGEKTRSQQEIADEFGVSLYQVWKDEQRLHQRIMHLSRSARGSVLNLERKRIEAELNSETATWEERIRKAPEEEKDAIYDEKPERPLLLQFLMGGDLPPIRKKSERSR